MQGIIVKDINKTNLNCPKCNQTLVFSCDNLHRDTMVTCINCNIAVFHPEHMSKNSIIRKFQQDVEQLKKEDSIIKKLQQDVEQLKKDVKELQKDNRNH